MRRVYFNGKFYAAGINGVHRVADRLIREVDFRLGALPAHARPFTASLLIPKRRQWTPQLANIALIEQPSGHSQVWEQFILPLRAADGLLVNLCNLAPVMHASKLMLLHDAQFLFPDSSYPTRLRWGYRLLTPWMARTSIRVFTVSEYSRQLLDLFGVARRDRVDVIHNGADHLLDVPARPGAADRLGIAGRTYVAHFASPKAYKNSAVVFEAFADPRLAETTLLLLGAGRSELERAGLIPPPNAVFAGRVDDADLRDIYEHALCLLFPSRTEGFGLPPVEAMMCGCPSVVAPAGAIPEICRDAAVYEDVADPAGWVAAMLRYRDDKEHRAAKVALGRERAAQFTWAVAGRALFESIAEHAGPTP